MAGRGLFSEIQFSLSVSIDARLDDRDSGVHRVHSWIRRIQTRKNDSESHKTGDILIARESRDLPAHAQSDVFGFPLDVGCVGDGDGKHSFFFSTASICVLLESVPDRTGRASADLNLWR